MGDSFDILDYLSGLTGFVFDKSVLSRVAHDNNVHAVTDYAELTEEQKDKCKIDLLKTVLASPNSTASVSVSHGNYTKSIGAQTITEAVRQSVRNELKSLYQKYDMQEELTMMDCDVITWIEEMD